MPAMASAEQRHRKENRGGRGNARAQPPRHHRGGGGGGGGGGPATAAAVLFEDGWRTLEAGLIAPLQEAVEASQGDGRAVRRLFGRGEFSALYTHVYTMCTQKAPHNWSGKLYFEYKKSLDRYLASRACPAVRRRCQDAATAEAYPASAPQAATALLREVDQQWRNHLLYTKWAGKFLGYLDRFYVVRLAVDSLATVALKSFKANVFDAVKDHLTAAFCCVVSHERVHSGVGRHDAMLSRLADMYHQLGRGASKVYEMELEKPLVERARADARASASAWLDRDTLAEYLQRAETRLDDEARRAEEYLRPSSHAKLQKCSDDELLAPSQIQTVLLQREDGDDEGNLDNLLSTGCRPDLQRLYRLFSRVGGGLDAVAAAFREHVNRAGAAMVRSTKDARGLSTLVQRLSGLHSRYGHLIDACFHGDVLFTEALRTAFESAANIEPPVGRLKMAELVADLFDRELRRAGKEGRSARGRKKSAAAATGGGGELSVEASIRDASEMFAYLRDKDVFADAYRKQLAKRLLTLRPRDGGAAEAHAVGLLKERMGAQYTAKLEGMINDIASTKQVERDFAAYLADPEDMLRASRAGALADEADSVLSPARRPRLSPTSAALIRSIPFGVRVQVLTNGHWPASKTLAFKLPAAMSKVQSVFENFYNIQRANRKLRWAHALGTVVVEARLPAGRLDMVMSELQCAILVLFNDEGAGAGVRLSPAFLVRQLGVEPKDLAKHLAPMLRGKYPLLTDGRPATDGLPDDDARITVNRAFHDPSGRIKFPVGMPKGGGGGKRRKGGGRGGGDGAQASPRPGDGTADRVAGGGSDGGPRTSCIAASSDTNSAEVRESRKQLSDASIVRVMKAKTRMRLRPLIDAVKKDVSHLWAASGQELNKRVEDLIERDYLERSETDQLMLEYVP